MPAPIPQAGAPSTRQYLLAALREGCHAQPAGLTLPEWRARVTDTVALTTQRFGGHVQSLRRTGLVATHAGRVGHQRYVPADLPCDPTAPAPADFVLLVLAALRAAEAKAGHPVPVGLVTQALPRDVVIPHINAVRRALGTLATPRRRGAEALRHPVHRRTTLGPAGHRTTLWSTAPITTIPLRPRSRVEALRQLVSWAQQDVGIPLAASWLGPWAAARDGYAGWPAAWRRGLRRALTDAARRPTSCIEALQGRWAIVPRFVLTGDDAPVVRAAVALEEFAQRADLAQELELLTALTFRSRGSLAKQSALAERRRLLGALLAELLGEVPVETAVALLRSSIEVRQTLPRSRQMDNAWVALRVQLDALFALLPTLEIAPWPERPAVIGEAGLMTPAAVEGWAGAAVLATEMSPRNAHRIMVASGGIVVDGELRIDAVRAIEGLLRYTTTPTLHQRVADLVRGQGAVNRGYAEEDLLAHFLATGHLGASSLSQTTKVRLRAGALFGVLER